MNSTSQLPFTVSYMLRLSLHETEVFDLRNGVYLHAYERNQKHFYLLMSHELSKNKSMNSQLHLSNMT